MIFARFLTAVMFLMSFATSADAHSPYLGERCDTLLPDGSPATIVLHYGDGIIAADPVEPVIIDAAGRVIGVGPVATGYYLFCERDIATLRLYDAFERIFLTVDVENLQHEPLTELAPTEWYPSFRPPDIVERGFMARPAKSLEAVRTEIYLLPRHAGAIFWFTLVFMIVTLHWGVLLDRNRSSIERLLFGGLCATGFLFLMAISFFAAVIGFIVPRIFTFILAISFLAALSIAVLVRLNRSRKPADI